MNQERRGLFMLDFISHASDYLVANAGAIGTGLGVVWIIVAKFFSNEKAGKFVGALQGGLDIVAKGCELLGGLAHAASQILSKAISSDGFLGKK